MKKKRIWLIIAILVLLIVVFSIVFFRYAVIQGQNEGKNTSSLTGEVISGKVTAELELTKDADSKIVLWFRKLFGKN